MTAFFCVVIVDGQIFPDDRNIIININYNNNGDDRNMSISIIITMVMIAHMGHSMSIQQIFGCFSTDPLGLF